MIVGLIITLLRSRRTNRGREGGRVGGREVLGLSWMRGGMYGRTPLLLQDGGEDEMLGAVSPAFISQCSTLVTTTNPNAGTLYS